MQISPGCRPSGCRPPRCRPPRCRPPRCRPLQCRPSPDPSGCRPTLDRMTDACESITLPQTSFAGGNPASLKCNVSCFLRSGSTVSVFRYRKCYKGISCTLLMRVCAIKSTLSLTKSNPYPAITHGMCFLKCIIIFKKSPFLASVLLLLGLFELQMIPLFF